MAKVIGQDIPAFLYDQYKDILTLAVPHSLVKHGNYVRVLPSWREKLHVFESEEYKKIPPGRLAVWVAFKQACECWWKQKEEGTSWPPDVGPRDMLYWSMESLYERMGIFQFYMHKSIRPFYRTGTTDWCVYGPKRDTHIISILPDDNFWDWEETRIFCYHQNSFARMFIMKGPDEYDCNFLNLYVTNPLAGTATHYSDVGLYDLRANFFQDNRVTWNNQPAWYDRLTYQYITQEGWQKFWVGTGFHAFGLKLLHEETLPEEVVCDVLFASMQYPIESLRPYFYKA